MAEIFDEAMAARADNPDWTRRRGWDVPGYNGKRVPFETKLALVLDRQGGHFGRVLHAYGLRNHYAHGSTTVPVEPIPQLAKDLYTWQAELRR